MSNLSDPPTALVLKLIIVNSLILVLRVSATVVVVLLVKVLMPRRARALNNNPLTNLPLAFVGRSSSFRPPRTQNG